MDKPDDEREHQELKNVFQQIEGAASFEVSAGVRAYRLGDPSRLGDAIHQVEGAHIIKLPSGIEVYHLMNVSAEAAAVLPGTLFGPIIIKPPEGHYYYCPGPEPHLLSVLDVGYDVDGNPICRKHKKAVEDITHIIPNSEALRAAIQRVVPKVRTALGAKNYRSFKQRLDALQPQGSDQELLNLFNDYPAAGDLLVLELLKSQ